MSSTFPEESRAKRTRWDQRGPPPSYAAVIKEDYAKKNHLIKVSGDLYLKNNGGNMEVKNLHYKEGSIDQSTVQIHQHKMASFIRKLLSEWKKEEPDIVFYFMENTNKMLKNDYL